MSHDSSCLLLTSIYTVRLIDTVLPHKRGNFGFVVRENCMKNFRQWSFLGVLLTMTGKGSDCSILQSILTINPPFTSPSDLAQMRDGRVLCRRPLLVQMGDGEALYLPTPVHCPSGSPSSTRDGGAPHQPSLSRFTTTRITTTYINAVGDMKVKVPQRGQYRCIQGIRFGLFSSNLLVTLCR